MEVRDDAGDFGRLAGALSGRPDGRPPLVLLHGLTFDRAMCNILPGVRANRAFLRRAVQYLVGEAGIRQFLDIGTGLPTNENTHQVAQGIAPAPWHSERQLPDL
jgi:hypothetical protein